MCNGLRRMKNNHSIPETIPDEVANESSISSITNPNEVNESSESSDHECVVLGENNNEPKRRGRPKGTGRSCRRKLDSVIKSAHAQAAIEFKTCRDEGSVKRGTLNSTCWKIEDDLDLPLNSVNRWTVRSRVNRNRLAPVSQDAPNDSCVHEASGEF